VKKLDSKFLRGRGKSIQENTAEIRSKARRGWVAPLPVYTWHTVFPTTTGTASPGPYTTAPPPTSECGKKNFRIVGGEATDENEYPWQVGLSRPGERRIWCGGSLVSSQWVITAAHCIVEQSSLKPDLHFGAHYNNFPKAPCPLCPLPTVPEKDQNRQTRKSIVVTLHPDYTFDTLNFDIAVIKMDKEIEFSAAISPVCLPPATMDYTGKTVTVTGWGRLWEYGAFPTELQEVDLIVTSQQECKEAYGKIYTITENMICAKAPGKDSCQGDSGGPVVYKRGDTYELAGVVSWGIGCARPSRPGIYTDVANANILQWLNAAMQ